MDFTTRVNANIVTESMHPEPTSMEKYRARDPVTLVIFGASGDLSRRKLIPALFRLEKEGYLPDRYAIVGFSRTLPDDAQFRLQMQEILRNSESPEEASSPAGQKLIGALFSQQGDNDDPKAFATLHERLDAIEAQLQLPGNRLFYLSVAPEFFAPIIRNLDAAGLIRSRCEQCWSRVIVEKPFGTDLQSARDLKLMWPLI